MLVIRKTLFSICLVISFNTLSIAQNDSVDIYDLNFEQLSKLKVSSATKVLQDIEEIPSTVYVITESEIKERGYFVLEDIFSSLPGFQFRNIQGLNTYSFLRGIPNQNNLLLILVDGIQINELNSGGYYGGGQYNLSNVERIEIIYGPSSVVYGTNAISGIINIKTKTADKNELEVNTLVGSFNTLASDFSFSAVNKKENLGVHLSGMAKHTDKADLTGISGDHNWTDLMENFEKDYNLNVKFYANNFILGANYQQKKTSGATFVKSVGTIYEDYGTLWNIRFINSYLKYNKQLFDNIAFMSTLYNRDATVLDNSVLYIVDTAQIAYYRPNNLTGFENIINYNSSHLNITGGIVLEYEQLAESFSISISDSQEQKPTSPVKPDMEKNFLTSIFIEPQITFFENLYLSGGVRFDQSSIYDQVFTPRGGLSYNIKKQVVRFSYAEAYRAPKPWDYTDGFGNSNLLPEKMRSFELAFNLSFKENYSFDIVGYKNKLEDALTQEIVMDGYRWANIGEINTDGIEVGFGYTNKRIKSVLYYTYNDSYDESGRSVNEISKHTANADLTYSFNDYIKFNLRVNYAGERENPKLIESTNSKFVDPSIVFHGTISLLNYKNISTQVMVRNIFNTEYYHTSNRQPDRYRQSQRTVLLTIGYKFKN